MSRIWHCWTRGSSRAVALTLLAMPFICPQIRASEREKAITNYGACLGTSLPNEAPSSAASAIVGQPPFVSGAFDQRIELKLWRQQCIDIASRSAILLRASPIDLFASPLFNDSFNVSIEQAGFVYSEIGDLVLTASPNCIGSNSLEIFLCGQSGFLFRPTTYLLAQSPDATRRFNENDALVIVYSEVGVSDTRVSLPAPAVAPPPLNYTSMWWNSAESGWGFNVNHQGDTLFATLFTYDASGNPLWLVMSNGARPPGGAAFTGALYRTTGPAFNAEPFTPITGANVTQVGTMMVTFTGPSSATLTYSVNGIVVTKAIEKEVFGAAAANCVGTDARRASATNYTDMWWNASESGWGINLTQQGNVIFATLFTYASDGQGMWFVMANGALQSDGSYLGDFFRTTGPPFNAQPFTPITTANITKVGTMQFKFSDGNTGTLAYVVDGVSVSRLITRQVFSSPIPSCTS
jgi:hypothetical protein